MKLTRQEIESQDVEVSIDIPSGEMVFSDWLGQGIFEIKKDFDVNQLSGIKQSILAYGEIGLFHGFVGNSCPGLYKDGNKIYIGHKKEEGKSKISGEKVGSICTDLWWYSIADRAEYLKRGGSKKQEFFKVTPGRYLLKHRLNSNGWEEGDVVYATLELSKEKPKQWDLPEELIYKTLKEHLPTKLKKPYFNVKPHYEKVGKGYDRKDYKFVGYEASLMSDELFGSIKFTEDQFLTSSKKIMDKLLKNSSKGFKLEKLLMGSSEKSLSKETLDKIKKIVEDL